MAQAGGTYSLLDHLKFARGAADSGSAGETTDASGASDDCAESGEDILQGRAEDKAAHQGGKPSIAPESVENGSAWARQPPPDSSGLSHLDGLGLGARVADTLLSTTVSAEAPEGREGRQDESACRRRRGEAAGEGCIHLIPTPPASGDLSATCWRPANQPLLLEGCRRDGAGEQAGAGAGRLEAAIQGQGIGAALADHHRVQEKTLLLSQIATKDRRIRELEAALRSQQEQDDELRLLQEARAEVNLVSRAADVRARAALDVAARAWHSRIRNMGRALRRLQAACVAHSRLSSAVLAMSTQRRVACVSSLFSKWAGRAGRRYLLRVLESDFISRRPKLIRTVDRCGRGCRLSPGLLAFVLLSDSSRLLWPACVLASIENLPLHVMPLLEQEVPNGMSKFGLVVLFCCHAAASLARHITNAPLPATSCVSPCHKVMESAA